jgi:hypothetical protein
MMPWQKAPLVDRTAPATIFPEESGMADQTNLQAHVASYDRMIAMMKWGGLAVFLIAAFIVWLIA